MPAILQLVVRMDGWPGAPGFMTFYGDAGGGFQADVKAFVDTATNACPSNITFTVPNEGNVIDDATGTITSTWSEGTAATFTGGTGGTFSAASGAVINWLTNTFVSGRRLRGKTFLVPLASAAYDTDGTIGSTSLAPLRAAADALVAGGNIVVWHRPVGGAGGSSAPAVNAAVPDRVAILTSRRA